MNPSWEADSLCLEMRSVQWKQTLLWVNPAAGAGCGTQLCLGVKPAKGLELKSVFKNDSLFVSEKVQLDGDAFKGR